MGRPRRSVGHRRPAVRCPAPVVEQPGGSPGPCHLAFAARAALVRPIVRRPHDRRVPPVPRVRPDLRLRRRPQPCGGASAHPAAGRATKRPHPVLPARGAAQPDRDLAPGFRRRAGLRRVDRHQPGLEHDLQLLPIADDDPRRAARGVSHLSLRPVAAFQDAGAALRHARAGLELHDVVGGRLVLPDGRRDLHGREPRFPPAGAGQLPADGRQCRRFQRHFDGRRHIGADHRPVGSTGLAADAGLGRPIQGRDGRERQSTGILVLRRPEPRLADRAARRRLWHPLTERVDAALRPLFKRSDTADPSPRSSRAFVLLIGVVVAVGVAYGAARALMLLAGLPTSDWLRIVVGTGRDAPARLGLAAV